MSAELVVDASVVVDLLLDNSSAAAVAECLADRVLYAPHHLDAEVLSAVARGVRAEDIDSAVATIALGQLARMPVQRRPLTELLGAAWQLRDNVRVTDGFYVALARSLACPLVTSDARLGRAVRQQALCDVVVIE